MKNSLKNSLVLIAAVCFAAIGFVGAKTNAQTKKPAAKPTPKPTAKKSPDAKAKPVSKSAEKSKTMQTSGKTTAQKNQSKSPAKSKSATAPQPAPISKAAIGEQIIVVAAPSKIRREPKANSTQIAVAKIGKTFAVGGRNGDWYRVEYASGKSGWISGALIKNYKAGDRDKIYADIANRYFKQKTIDVGTAAEVLEFLRTAQTLIGGDDGQAELNLKRLRVLSLALKSIPAAKSDEPPYKNFLKTNEKEIVYSDPGGQWFVRSEILWDLRERFAKLPIAEEIAWDAAQNPIPGECEGYVNCYLYQIRATDGEYLSFYPNGRRAKEALKNLTDYLEPLAAELKKNAGSAPPSDISDRAEFNRFLTELRAIVSKMSDLDKEKSLRLIKQIGDDYR